MEDLIMHTRDPKEKDLLVRINELVNNIQQEIKLNYPFIRLTKAMIMKKAGYDRSYLYPSKYKILSEYIYKRLHSRLKDIDIDDMVAKMFYFDYNKRGD